MSRALWIAGGVIGAGIVVGMAMSGSGSGSGSDYESRPSVKPLPLDASYVRAKADILEQAWRAQYPGAIDQRALALALVPAIVETGAGDSWGNNWGSTLLRPVNAAELAALTAAGFPASPTPPCNAADAQAALAAAGFAIVGSLHCDSKQWRWFRVFDSQEAGAAFYLRTLLGTAAHHKGAWDIVHDPRASPSDLAAAMKRQRYFESPVSNYKIALESRWPSVANALGVQA